MKSKKLLITGVILAILGLAGTLPTAYYWLQNRHAFASGTVVQAAPQPNPGPTLVQGKPAKLIIKSLNMNLKVVDGIYNQNNGSWTLSLDKAHFALPSVMPNNESGNTLIYGHYRPEVFAYLHLIQPGAKAQIITENGYIFSYTFTGSKNYNPSDTSIFAYQGPPQLTIQTCSGSWFQNRQLFTFKYNGYKKLK